MYPPTSFGRVLGMRFKQTPQKFVGMVLSILIILSTGHCIIEELFASSIKLFQVMSGVQGPEQEAIHLTLGYEESSDAHQISHLHGQPHSIEADLRIVPSLIKLILHFAACSVLTLICALFFSICNYISSRLSYTTKVPDRSYLQGISSLTSSPQAPPIS